MAGKFAPRPLERNMTGAAPPSPAMSRPALMLFALDASRACGEAVARALGIALSAREERVFEDAEHKLRALESVRERDVYVLHSLHSEPGQSIDDKLEWSECRT